MIPYLSCGAARETLEAFIDDELLVNEQVALESHLRWCVTCRARIEDMQLIGTCIRQRSTPRDAEADEVPVALSTMQSDVLTRIRAERDQSLPVRFRQMFEDARFMWPAIGATTALVACLLAAMTVHRATRGGDPESMASMIDTLARAAAERRPLRLEPLSSYYPVQLDRYILAPRPLDSGAELHSLPEDDAVFALSAVVTREGRVANYELLQSERAGRLHRRAAARTDDVDALLDAVKRSRFEPAQGAGGGAVTVRLVWLLARTTVKAQVEEVLKPLSDGLPPPPVRPARS